MGFMKTGSPAPAVSIQLDDWFSEERLESLNVDQLRDLVAQVKDPETVGRIRRVLARKGG